MGNQLQIRILLSELCALQRPTVRSIYFVCRNAVLLRQHLSLTNTACSLIILKQALQNLCRTVVHLQYLPEYIYLGQLVAFKQTMKRGLKRRIAIPWRTFWSLKFIVLDRNLNRRLRFEALESCFFPALLYGCQTWKLAQNQKKKIQVCQRKMERKILGISLRDRILNALANTADAVQRATILKWK